MRLIVSFTIFATTAAAQFSPECRQLQTQLETFIRTYNPYRDGGPKATAKTIEDELGKPTRLEAGVPDGFTAVFVKDDCTGEVLIGANGFAWYQRIKATSVIPSDDKGAPLERIRNIQKKIETLKQEIAGLESLKQALITQYQTSAHQPAPNVHGNLSDGNVDADTLFTQEKYVEAEQAYTLLIKKDATDARAFLRRAYCYQKMARFQNAISDYSTVIALKPTLALAYQNRALAYLAVNDSEKALADQEKAKAFAVTATPTATSVTNAPTSSVPSSTYYGSGGSTNVPGTDVHVRGYTRKDGTYVPAHTRSAPGRRK